MLTLDLTIEKGEKIIYLIDTSAGVAYIDVAGGNLTPSMPTTPPAGFIATEVYARHKTVMTVITDQSVMCDGVNYAPILPS